MNKKQLEFLILEDIKFENKEPFGFNQYFKNPFRKCLINLETIRNTNKINFDINKLNLSHNLNSLNFTELSSSLNSYKIFKTNPIREFTDNLFSISNFESRDLDRINHINRFNIITEPYFLKLFNKISIFLFS